MKRTVSLMLSFLLLIQLFSPLSAVFAEDNGAEELSWGISYINATYLEETVDVT